VTITIINIRSEAIKGLVSLTGSHINKAVRTIVSLFSFLFAYLLLIQISYKGTSNQTAKLPSRSGGESWYSSINTLFSGTSSAIFYCDGYK
jgi:hypothetical protein